MKYERHVANFCLDLSKRIEGKTGPVCGILAVDITDTSSQHCNAQVSNHLALLRISALAHTDYAVFLAADRTYLSLEGDTEDIAGVYKSSSLCDVLFDRIVRAVEHDGGEACVDASLSAFEGAVVKVQSNRNGDVKVLDHALYHADDGRVTAHILACALRNTEDNRRLALLCGEKDSLCPLKVVDVELTNSVLAVASLVQHFFCRN